MGLKMVSGTLMIYLRNRLLRTRLERVARPRPLIPQLPLVLRNPPDPRQVHFLHLMGASMKVGVPSAWGYTSMLIVERLSESQIKNRLLKDLGVVLFASEGDTKQFVVILRRNVIVVDAIIQHCERVNSEKVDMATEFKKLHELVSRGNQSLIQRFM